MINVGVAFGIGQGISQELVGIALVVVVVIAVKTRELWGKVGLGMIVIGGVANLYMRIKYGGVMDNLILFGILYNNVWDYLIVGGLILYGYSHVRELGKLGESENRKIRGSDDKNNFCGRADSGN